MHAGDTESLHSGTSKISEFVMADDLSWSCEEEIEAAIMQANAAACYALDAYISSSHVMRQMIAPIHGNKRFGGHDRAS